MHPGKHTGGCTALVARCYPVLDLGACRQFFLSAIHVPGLDGIDASCSLTWSFFRQLLLTLRASGFKVHGEDTLCGESVLPPSDYRMLILVLLLPISFLLLIAAFSFLLLSIN